MILTSVIVGLLLGRIDQVVMVITSSAKEAFELALGLTGVMTLWLGIMGIASESGLVARFAHYLKPIMHRLFPEIPPEDPAIGAIVMNITANMLGLVHAATPFGLQAMKELQRLNVHGHTASNAMCTFLAINTSSVQLIPATAIAFLAANGALHPESVIFTSLVATTVSTVVAIIAVKQLAKCRRYRLPETPCHN
jgi:spore maturation protein A